MLPAFPVPFWDADTVMIATFSPVDMERMVMPEPRTVLERNLDGFTSAIREKTQWWIKIHSPDVVERWRLEGAQQDVDDATFEFALQVRSHPAMMVDAISL